jgi:hypothetical protein
MKGLIISLLVFAAYVPLSAILCHILKVKRHGRLFFPMMGLSVPVYVALFYLTPDDLGFLSPAWQATHTWVDALSGAVILVLNVHSFIDYFFAFNGGFSTSLMLLLRDGPRTTEELVAAYRGEGGIDKIYGWRIHFLLKKGYITIDESRVCRLTPRGVRAARIGIFAKRFLNLGRGG